MKINNKELSLYSAELLDRQFYTTNINSICEWPDQWVEGILLNQHNDYRRLYLSILVSGDNEDDAYKKISKLTDELKNSIIKFDDINLSFHCVLDGSNTPERMANGIFKIQYNLKNDIGKDDNLISLNYNITSYNAKEIRVLYYDNRIPVIHHYTDCFDQDELLLFLQEEHYYINLDELNSFFAQSNSWTNLFYNLGIDVNKYKPKANNTLNGQVQMDNIEYNLENVIKYFNDLNQFSIFYNRFQTDGIADMPENVCYPSIVLSADSANNNFFDLGIGNGYDINKLQITSIGRFYQIGRTNSAGPMFGDSDRNYSYILSSTGGVSIFLGGQHALFAKNVYQYSKTSYEDINNVSINKYEINANNSQSNRADIIFGGKALGQGEVLNYNLASNLQLLKSSSDYGKCIDLARITINYDGAVKMDAIPVNTHMKNGFLNYKNSLGFYDTINMKWIPYSGTTSGDNFDDWMDIPTPSTPILNIKEN